MGIDDRPQFQQGKAVEAYLDAYFRWRGWAIYPMSDYDERTLHLGDRYFVDEDQVLKVEYKSGIQTGYTGNLFLETVSVDARNIPGWVYTSQADYILYATLLNDRILVFRPQRLRAVIEQLRERFREVATSHNQNDGYDSRGVLVPLAWAEEHLADKVIEL